MRAMRGAAECIAKAASRPCLAQRYMCTERSVDRAFGETLYNDGNFEDAVAAFKLALEHDPKSKEIAHNLVAALQHQGVGLFKKGDMEGGIAAMEAALEIRPDSPDTLQNLGVALLLDSDFDRAISVLKKGISLPDPPNQVQLYYYLGWAMEGVKDLSGAVANYEKVLNLEEENADAQRRLTIVRLAEEFRSEGEPELADACLKVDELTPEDIQAKVNLSLVMEEDVYALEAIAILRVALALDPRDADAYFNLGTVLENRKGDKEKDNVIPHLRRAVELEPSHAQAHAALGGTLHVRRDFDGALEHFDIALTIDEMDGQTHYQRGLVYGDMGKYDEAIAGFRRALGTDKEMRPALEDETVEESLSSALNLKATELLQAGEHKGALAAYEEALVLQPESGDLWHSCGVVLSRTNDFKEATAAYEKAIAFESGIANYHHNLARAREHTRDLTGAIAAYEAALALTPDHAEGQHSLGCLLSKCGRTEESIAAFRAAIHTDPRRMETVVHLATALERLGDLDGAISTYRVAISDVGNNLEPKEIQQGMGMVRHNLGAILCSKGDYTGAVDVFQEAVAIDPDSAVLHCNLGYALLANQDGERAKAALTRAMQLDKKYTDEFLLKIAKQQQ